MVSGNHPTGVYDDSTRKNCQEPKIRRSKLAVLVSIWDSEYRRLFSRSELFFHKGYSGIYSHSDFRFYHCNFSIHLPKKMKTIYLFPMLLLYTLSCSKSKISETGPVVLSTKMDSISYGMGVNLGSSYKRQDFDIDPDLFFNGFVTSYNEQESLLTENDTRQILRDYYKTVRMNKSEKQNLLAEENQKKSSKFLKNNKTADGVIELSSGLQYKVIRAGSGASPTVNESVKVHYTGKHLDGTVFDSSVESNEPAIMSLRSVPKGWKEALQLMNPGAKWELYIPPALAYGRRGSGGKIGPNELLILEVELIDIVAN